MNGKNTPPVQLSDQPLPGANRGSAPVVPLTVNQPPLMKVGFNYPWVANLYGNHIGPNRWKNPPSAQVDPVWKDTGGSLQRNLALLV